MHPVILLKGSAPSYGFMNQCLNYRISESQAHLACSPRIKFQYKYKYHTLLLTPYFLQLRVYLCFKPGVYHTLLLTPYFLQLRVYLCFKPGVYVQIRRPSEIQLLLTGNNNS